MPRGRMLNKKISYDEKVSKLSLESKLLFTWIIPHLDVKGRFFAESEIIKGQVCPFVDELPVKKISKCLLEIEKVGLINIYGEDHKYLEYCGFSKNQTITETRESPSDIPDPTQAKLMQESSTTQIQVKLSKDNISKEKIRGEAHPLQTYVSQELPNVSKLKNQLTLGEAERLISEFPENMIKEILEAMDNKADLTKKYVSVNRTLRNWIKMELPQKSKQKK